MKLKAIAATSLLSASVLLSANIANAELVINCDRGLIPKNSLINSASRKFVDSLQANFVITEDEAKAVASQVCGDMSAVGDLNRLVDLTKAATVGFKKR